MSTRSPSPSFVGSSLPEGALRVPPCIEFHIVGATTNEQARRRLLASLREGGGFCVAKDGRSRRHVGVEQASCRRFFNLLFIVNEKEKGEVSENHIAFEDSFAFGFSLSHFSCFFFRKRRNKRNQTEREKRRKASSVTLTV